MSFNQAVSVSITGNEVFVLDAEAINETEAIKVVTVGAPEIESITPKSVSMDNGAVVTIKGKNFAPESIVTFADKAIENIEVVSANEIKVTILAQKAPGTGVLSVLTRGGLAQQGINVIAKPVGELAVGEITTIAGGLISNGDGGLATKASLFGISSLLVDSNRNLFIADSINQRVRKVDSQTGILTTIAGGGTAFRDGELALLSQIRPGDLALDNNGNLFIVDDLTASVRRLDLTTNIITTVAGGELGQASGDGGLATKAILGDLFEKISIAFRPNGNLLIGASNRIREVDSKTGIITTIVGTGNRVFSGDGGPAIEANIAPSDIVVDSTGNIFIAEFDNKRIRKIDANTGTINTIAGNGNGYTGRIEDNRPATEVALTPISLVLGPNNILFANSPVLVKIDLTTNIINRLDYKDPATIDGLIPSNELAIDGLGNLFMDVLNRIIMLPINETLIEAKTIAGSNLVNLRGDGDLAVNAGLGFAGDVVADSQNNLFISDLLNEVVRKVDSSTGVISTFAGSGPKVIFTPSQGDGKTATDPDVVFSPDSLQIDKNSNLLILDSFNQQIRNINANTQIISTIAGIVAGSKKDDIKAKKASLTSPIDLIVDSNGNIFISEIRRIRKIDAKTKKITTIAGNGRVGDINNIPDNVPAISVEIAPREIVTDPQGNIFINDRNRIRRIDGQTNIITTIAGNGKIGFRDADTPLNTSLGTVSGLAMDKAGNIFIASFEFVESTSVSGGFFNTRIWRLDAQSGKLTVFASGKADEYSGDGGQVANARVAGTPVLSIDADGNLLIVSTDLQTFSYVRLVKLSN
ncbi:MAG: IPT/TIG domain-containing protein [Blastocatellia bacterium]|nr:IPT/TIG domain-containing protein [Blastocatellia bacterium]